jgi:hypothetical protein
MEGKDNVPVSDARASCSESKRPGHGYHKDSKNITPEQYARLKENLLREYSDPSLYAHIDTPSGNVYVYAEHYRRYVEREYCKSQIEILEKEIRAAEVFGMAGYEVFILPEQIFFDGEEYNSVIPDALMNGYLLEFKKLESNTYDAFQRNLSEGLMKSDIVYMEISDSILEYKNRGVGYRNALFGEVKKHGYPLKYVVVSVNGKDATSFEIKIGHPTNGTPLGEVRQSPSSL